MTRNILMIIAPEQFRDEELQTPRQILQAEGWTVDTVSERLGEATGMLGAKETITLDLNHAEQQVQQAAYDAVVIVGGMGSPSFLWDNAPIHRIINTLNSQGKVVAAICLSGVVLAKAGVLNGKRATVWEMPESVAIYEQHQVQYTGEPVTIDGTLVTANGPDAAKAFGEALVAQLKAAAPVA